MEYDLELKNARLGLVRDRLNSGALEILSDTGERLAVIEFDKQSGAVMFGVLTFNSFPKFAMGETKGRATSGQLLDKSGAVKAQGLTVGIHDPAKRRFDIELEHVEVNTANVVKIERAEIRHA